jgi:hypothetical protein
MMRTVMEKSVTTMSISMSEKPGNLRFCRYAFDKLRQKYFFP